MAAKKIIRPIFDNRYLNITVNPDGTVKRDPEVRNPPNPDPNSTSSVLSKDITLDPNKNTWLRLYIPKPPPTAKLPLIFYYHGGGFVFCNADSSIFDVFCKGLVESLGAIVISLDYRLAPEYRLPAAYEDAVDGFFWVKNTKDKWITEYADLNNCFLCGTSAGGNLAYHAGLRFAAMAGDLGPLKVRGMILHVTSRIKKQKKNEAEFWK
ncbi:Carboxylesterase [Handroanthus impetiginosus]|uniref:Carboxylesterase n=1 Tax=Handroanthus impetiginosus TaxID=429701 RepID=A0A2G9GEE8_9LAMI|nr:Carboxylesterase [Handroanthus impetiginosus]